MAPVHSRAARGSSAPWQPGQRRVGPPGAATTRSRPRAHSSRAAVTSTSRSLRGSPRSTFRSRQPPKGPPSAASGGSRQGRQPWSRS
eukprot:13807016-Alexandrium_andersonii.AAC.1